MSKPVARYAPELSFRNTDCSNFNAIHLPCNYTTHRHLYYQLAAQYLHLFFFLLLDVSTINFDHLHEAISLFNV